MDQLCSCSVENYCLWYRYTMEEMTEILDALRARLDLCQKWKILVHRLIQNDHQNLIGSFIKENVDRIQEKRTISLLEFDDFEKHCLSGALCLRDDIRVKIEEKLEEAVQCRQEAREVFKRLTCK